MWKGGEWGVVVLKGVGEWKASCSVASTEDAR